MTEWLAMPHTLSHDPVSMGSYSTVRHVPSARLAGWSSPQFCLGELICEPHGLQFNAYPLNQTGDVKTGRFIINISVNTRPRDPRATANWTDANLKWKRKGLQKKIHIHLCDVVLSIGWWHTDSPLPLLFITMYENKIFILIDWFPMLATGSRNWFLNFLCSAMKPH